LWECDWWCGKKKGQKVQVRLTVKKVDGTIKVISIIRDIVEIETYAKSSIVKNGLKYGVIYLPKFYIDFETKTVEMLERYFRSGET
jgi:carboxyl-terminal processing protease